MKTLWTWIKKIPKVPWWILASIGAVLVLLVKYCWPRRKTDYPQPRRIPMRTEEELAKEREDLIDYSHIVKDKTTDEVKDEIDSIRDKFGGP